jgi:hypothetical protein
LESSELEDGVGPPADEPEAPRTEKAGGFGVQSPGSIVEPRHTPVPGSVLDGPISSAPLARRPREVRFIIPEGYVHRERPPEIDVDPVTFSAPTDFSKSVRFPRGFLCDALQQSLLEEAEPSPDDEALPEEEEAWLEEADPSLGDRATLLEDSEALFEDGEALFEEEEASPEQDQIFPNEGEALPEEEEEEEVQPRENKAEERIVIRALTGDDIRHASLGEIESQYGSSIRPLGLGDVSDDLEAFLEVETRLEEEEETVEAREVIPNFDAILHCVQRRVPQPALKRNIQQTLTAQRDSHFVLLLLEPGPSIEGVYTLDSSFLSVTKIWGDTPDTIAADETDRFWKYNDITGQFVEQPSREFTSFTDAITL